MYFLLNNRQFGFACASHFLSAISACSRPYLRRPATPVTHYAFRLSTFNALTHPCIECHVPTSYKHSQDQLEIVGVYRLLL